MPLLPIAIISIGGSLGLWSLGKAAEGGAELISESTKLLIVGGLALGAVVYLKGK